MAGSAWVSWEHYWTQHFLRYTPHKHVSNLIPRQLVCGWLIPILSHHISHFEIEPTQKVVDLKLPVCFDLDFQLVVIVQIVEHKGLVPYRGHRLLLHRRFLFGLRIVFLCRWKAFFVEKITFRVHEITFLTLRRPQRQKRSKRKKRWMPLVAKAWRVFIVKNMLFLKNS